MRHSCDECERTYESEEGFAVMQRRPSDPLEMVCILYFCDEHGEPYASKPSAEGGCAKPSEWHDWFENNMDEHKMLWLTI